MPVAVRADSTDHPWEPSGSSSMPRRTTALMAGVAMASAGVISVNPVTSPPAMTEIREAAVELAALRNPLTAWQQTLTNTLGSLTALGEDISTSQTALALALTNPALYTELLDFVTTNVANPLLIPTALLSFPSDHGETIITALTELLTSQEGAFTTLPGVLQESLGYLLQGEFVEAFSPLNVWFLVNVLGDSRQSLLDAFGIPGDFLESIGLEPLGRVFDAILDRGVVGNLGRALLTAQVTSTIQTLEVFDLARAALQRGEIDTAISELIDLPAKFVNAFVNGYVPGFPIDYPSSPNQRFPGIFHELGFFNFFFSQIPAAIAAALAPPAAPDTAAGATAALPGPEQVPAAANTLAFKVDIASAEAGSVSGDVAKTVASSSDSRFVTSAGVDSDGFGNGPAVVPTDPADDLGDGFGDDLGDDLGDWSGDDLGDDLGDGFGEDLGDGLGDGLGDDLGDGLGDGLGDDDSDAFGPDPADATERTPDGDTETSTGGGDTTGGGNTGNDS